MKPGRKPQLSPEGKRLVEAAYAHDARRTQLLQAQPIGGTISQHEAAGRVALAALKAWDPPAEVPA